MKISQAVALAFSIVCFLFGLIIFFVGGFGTNSNLLLSFTISLFLFIPGTVLLVYAVKKPKAVKLNKALTIHDVISMFAKNPADFNNFSSYTGIPRFDNSDDLVRDMKKYYTIVQVKNDYRIARESFELANKTHNLNVFCNRYELCMQKALLLLAAEQAGVYKANEHAHKACVATINCAQSLKMRALYDCIQNTQNELEKIDRLKDKKRKIFKLKTMLESLEEAKPIFNNMQEYETLCCDIQMYLDSLINLNSVVQTLISNNLINQTQSQGDAFSIQQFNSIPEMHQFNQKDNTPIHFNDFVLHPDLQGLIWFIDGPMKNYEPETKYNSFQCNDYVVTTSISFSTEPSAISIYLPIQKSVSSFEMAPSYYPSYQNLTPTQRWKYLEFLSNPYSNHDIGYVFILYYGLERHLLIGDFDAAFDIILKLRKIYSNNSFQSYSSNALILISIMRKRFDKLNLFMSLLDENSVKKIPAEVYILAKFFCNSSISATDIIQNAKDFGFTNYHYIKSDPDIFQRFLSENLTIQFSQPSVPLLEQYTQNTPAIAVPVFANFSFSNNTICIPDYFNNAELKSQVYNILSQTHEQVKKYKAEQRKLNKIS